MAEIKAQQFTVEPDPGNPAAELSLRKLDLYGSPVAQIAFGNDSNTYLSFQTNPGGTMAEQMRIHTNGNVGIGTATPAEKLEVAGTVKATAFDGNLNGSQITTGTVADARLPLSISRTADVDARFDPSTGHKHTGAAGDGAQISHSTLTEIIGADPGSTDTQTNKHVSNAQTKQWQDHANVTSGNPHGTTAAQIDTQGGTNQIVAQINGGSGIIDQTRIDSVLVRTPDLANALTDKLSGKFVQGAVQIPASGFAYVPVTTQNVTNKIVAVRGWASVTSDGAPGLLTGNDAKWSPLPSTFKEGWSIILSGSKGRGGFFTFVEGSVTISLTLNTGDSGISFYLMGPAVGTVVGYAFQFTW